MFSTYCSLVSYHFPGPGAAISPCPSRNIQLAMLDFLHPWYGEGQLWEHATVDPGCWETAKRYPQDCSPIWTAVSWAPTHLLRHERLRDPCRACDKIQSVSCKCCNQEMAGVGRWSPGHLGHHHWPRWDLAESHQATPWSQQVGGEWSLFSILFLFLCVGKV